MNRGSPPVVFSVRAERALFTRHDLRIERYTYEVPTFGAIAGVLRSIYAKPAFYWVPTRVLVLKPIRFQRIMVNEVKDQVITQGPFVAPDRRMQKMQTYLYDVHYVAEAHFEWSGKQPDDENLGKHLDVFRRSLAVGGRRDVFLGLRECSAVAEPVAESFNVILRTQRDAWRATGQTGLTMDIGWMFHGWQWGTAEDGTDTPTFFHAVVRDGVLEYPHPSDRSVIPQRFVRRLAQ